MDDDADADGDEEEQHGLDEHAADTGTLTRAGAQHAGQHDDADDVINDCRADDGRTKEAFQMAQFCSVATVMETLVAVMMVPMNSAR